MTYHCTLCLIYHSPHHTISPPSRYLSDLSVDERAAVRKSACQTLFSTISAHGTLLQPHTWKDVLWKVTPGFFFNLPVYITVMFVGPGLKVLTPHSHLRWRELIRAQSAN